MGFESQTVGRGKPADYGQEIVKRRYRLTVARLDFNNKRVLDFGCGNGAQTIEFLDAGCKIIAVDIDRHDLSTLIEKLQMHADSSIVPVQYDGHSLPIPSESIDIVMSFEVMEHVTDECQALREIYRVLKPGGEMILSVPNKAWIFETHGANLPLLPWNRVPFFSWMPRAIHARFAKARIYRKQDIVKLLSSHSFTVTESSYVTAPMDVVKLTWLKTFLRTTIFSGDTTVIPFFSTSILVHCKKT